jgi:hypothetical protein
MRRTGTWLCLVVLLAMSAVAASTASAAEYELEGLPEFGHCVPSAPHKGEYKGKQCLTTDAGKGSFNWVPGPGPKPKFEGLISVTKLETVGKKFTIKCSFGVARGEYKSPKKATVALELVGCIRPETETKQGCQTNPGKTTEIEASFEGELGFIKGGSTPKVGLDLKPASPIVLTCGSTTEGFTPVTVEGSAIGLIRPIDVMRESFKLSYVAPGGKQSPEKFEGEPKDTLTMNWLSGLESFSEQTGLTIIGIEEIPKPLLIENEEALEIKAK